MPTPLELRLIHMASRQARLEEEHYRMILRNAGGVESSKRLDQRGFEDCMAVIEDAGFRHEGKPADYWRSKVSMRGSYCGERVVRKIETLAAGQKYDLAGLCRRVSKDRVSRPDKLSPGEGHAMIELLKAVIASAAPGQTPEISPGEAAGGLPGATTEAGMASESSRQMAAL